MKGNMNMKKMKSKIAFLMTFSLLVAMFLVMSPKIGAASNVDDAPVDWAFEASSVELNDAIVSMYPELDNGDGFVTISAANAMTGPLMVLFEDITGTINGIENFTQIDSLNLGYNQLSGNIPFALGDLTNLTELHLENNQFTGELPSSLGNLTNLTYLALNNNQLSGEIPSTLNNLTNVQVITLNNNQLSGSIPFTSSIFTNMINLFLDNNQLTGPIPASITTAMSLYSINLSSNQLSGEIPADIGNLVNLGQLNVNFNNLSGEIPASIGNLSSLTSLRLYNNNLSGEIPASMVNLSNLQTLDLSDNQLHGEIPLGLNDIPQLREFNFHNNQFVNMPQETYDFITNYSASHIYNVGTFGQTHVENLVAQGNLNEAYSFTGLPVYTQLPTYGMSVTYSLTAPDGTVKVITPTISGGIVTIAATDLDQIGAYKLEAQTGEYVSHLSVFANSLYTTNFEIKAPAKDFTYISAIANGVASKETSTKITITLSEDIEGLTLDDIILTPQSGSITTLNKENLIALGNGVYEITISGEWVEGAGVDVTIEKDGHILNPNTHSTVLHKRVGSEIKKNDDKDKGIKPIETGDTNTYATLIMLVAALLMSGGYLIVKHKSKD